MKTLIVFVSALFILNLAGLSQERHLSLIYDFKGADFDYPVREMVGVNDSLYIICDTPDMMGMFFRIDENGKGYKVIRKFDDVNRLPNSLVANDSVIYGTTRFSRGGGGSLFKYSLKDYSFEFIRDFDSEVVQETQIKYITDSVLWLTSQKSLVDEGSIFTIKKDGTQLKKIYNDMNFEKGQNPVDFVFYKNKIYIACHNGGGIPYPSGDGTYSSSGSFIRINTDGTGYENLVKGEDGKGTNPSSVIIRNNKIIGLFSEAGNNVNGRFFRCNLNGSSYEPLGAVSRRSLTKMLSTDSLIYGISFSQIFGVNPFDGEIRIFDDLLDNPEFGYDMVASPVMLNGKIFMTAQQGGPGGGGTILKWINKPPRIKDPFTKSSQTPTEIVLNDLFTDPEGDSLTYDFEFDSTLVAVSEMNGTLSLTPLTSAVSEVRITANDGWVGYKTYSLTVSPATAITDVETDSGNLIIFPNPANSVLNFGTKNPESVKIFTTNGKLIKSYKNPGSKIDISKLENGVYVIRYRVNGKIGSQRIVKY